MSQDRDPKVRYIKLGNGGCWFDNCLRDGTLRLGFWTGADDMLGACTAQDWDEVRRLLREKRKKGPKASVEDDLRQIRAVFDDDGSTTWITFHKRRMYWGRLDPSKPVLQVASDSEGATVHTLVGGWSSETTSEPPEPLRLDDLAGHLGKVTQYRGTICAPQDEGYVLTRIAGQESKLASTAKKRIGQLENSVVKMMKQLTPYDFEALVDMTFSANGWRRLGAAGKTEEGIDLLLVRSTIGSAHAAQDDIERVGVQIKSKCNTKQFVKAADKLGVGVYDRLLFVYHSGTIDGSRRPNVELVGAEQLAPMVLDAGLVRWLYRKVR